MKISIDDITINYFTYGSIQGLPVVFIHGFPFNHNMWEPQLLDLPDRNPCHHI